MALPMPDEHPVTRTTEATGIGCFRSGRTSVSHNGSALEHFRQTGEAVVTLRGERVVGIVPVRDNREHVFTCRAGSWRTVLPSLGESRLYDVTVCNRRFAFWKSV